MDFFWPRIRSVRDAELAAERAGGYAWVVAALTAVLGLAAIAGYAVLGVTVWALLDAGLFAIVGWRVWNKSFPWAVAGLVIYVLEKAGAVVEGQRPNILSFVILLGLVAGVRGTAYLRKHEKPVNGAVGSQAEATWER